MGSNGDLDDGVARPAPPLGPLPLQAQHLAVERPLRDVHVDHPAVGKTDPLLAALDGVFQVDRELGADVRAPAVETAEAAPGAARTVAEHLAQDVVDVDALEAGAGVMAVLERPATTETTTCAAAPEATHDLVPVGVDLAAVVALALVLVAQQVEGGAQSLEPLLGLLVTGVLVGMVLLRQLAERAAHFVGVGGAGDAELLIGILRQVGSSKNWSGDGPELGLFRLKARPNVAILPQPWTEPDCAPPPER